MEPYDGLDRLTPEQLNRWWLRRVRKVFALAARELPFYAERFAAAGFSPDELKSLDDLRRAPIFCKDDLLRVQRAAKRHAIGIEHAADPAADRVTLSLSSGTSGTTFISHTARWRRLQGASSCRAHWWAGLRSGGTFLMSAPAWHSYAAIQPVIARRFAMRCVVISGTYLPYFANRIVDAIVRFRPRFITMFLPMVFSILRAARDRGLEARRLFDGVTSLVVTGAPITPGMRRHLEVLTGIPRIAEIAGSSENLLAVDCEYSDGLHIVPDTCYAYVIDRATGAAVADGERGAVIHCALIPYGSLYLNYDGGDVGFLDRSVCRCGLPSPRIRLLGRREDSFRLGGREWLPYDVQLEMEQEVPELAGATCAISREGLNRGALRILLSEPEGKSVAPLTDGVRAALARRFAVPVEVVPVRELPLRFKGVPPLLSEDQLTGAQ